VLQPSRTMKNYTLPNGLTIKHANTYETLHLYEDVFGKCAYVNPGTPISEYLPPDAVVFDCGANIGMFSLFVLQHCPSAWIHAFEPAPATFELLKANTETHSRVRINSCGLGAECKQAAFVYLPMATAGSGYYDESVISGMKERLKAAFLSDDKRPGKELLQYLDKTFEQRVIVPTPVCTLSSYFDDNDIGAVDLLKIDVEGDERAVLDGIREEHWPRIRQVVLEVHKAHTGVDSSYQIVCLLAERGYRLRLVPEEGTLTTIVYGSR